MENLFTYLQNNPTVGIVSSAASALIANVASVIPPIAVEVVTFSGSVIALCIGILTLILKLKELRKK